MSHVNEDQNVSICTERLAALAKYTSPTDTVLVDGATYTQQEVVAAYQAPLDTRKAVTSARASTKGAIDKRKTADDERRKVDKGLKAWVVNTWGGKSPQAEEFGFATKTPAQPKAAVKAEAAAQAQRTKKARGILGRKARRAIKALPAPAPAK